MKKQLVTAALVGGLVVSGISVNVTMDHAEAQNDNAHSS